MGWGGVWGDGAGGVWGDGAGGGSGFKFGLWVYTYECGIRVSVGVQVSGLCGGWGGY